MILYGQMKLNIIIIKNKYNRNNLILNNTYQKLIKTDNQMECVEIFELLKNFIIGII